MQRSTDRILTSHVGSLPRPAELVDAFVRGAAPDEVDARLRGAVAEVVQRQVDAGIDIVNDGEFGKPVTDEIDLAAFANYLLGRLTGFAREQVDESDWFGQTAEGKAFPGFYASGEANATSDPDAPMLGGRCVGPIAYAREDLVARDVANLQAAIAGRGVADAFVSSLSAGGLYSLPGSYYPNDDDEAVAVAEALRTEYRAIVDAGLVLQIDNPQLVDTFFTVFADGWDLAGFRRWVDRHIELVNLALEGIPSDRVRCHICWGSWKGPHTMDLPLEEAIAPMLRINADLYSIEAANPRHEHEWRVWRDVALPEGKILMPGVVTHKTNVVEHPRVVADRIVRYAEIVGRENVIAGTDCGMGGRIHPEIAWAKLRALADGAELATRELWP